MERRGIRVVSILVLMDDGILHRKKPVVIEAIQVSILVLMDDGILQKVIGVKPRKVMFQSLF